MEFLKLSNIRCLVYELSETLNIYMLLSDIKELKIKHRRRTKQLPYWHVISKAGIVNTNTVEILGGKESL